MLDISKYDGSKWFWDGEKGPQQQLRRPCLFLEAPRVLRFSVFWNRNHELRCPEVMVSEGPQQQQRLHWLFLKAPIMLLNKFDSSRNISLGEGGMFSLLNDINFVLRGHKTNTNRHAKPNTGTHTYILIKTNTHSLSHSAQHAHLLIHILVLTTVKTRQNINNK